MSTISESHVASHWLIYWDGEVYVDEVVTSGDLTTYTFNNPCTTFGNDFRRFPTFRAWVRYKGSVTGWGPWGWGAGRIDDILKLTENFDTGPVERNDTSLGIDTFRWRLLLKPDGFYMYRENANRTDWDYRFILQDPSNKSDIKNFEFTFDQNGRPLLVFERSGNIYLYWYDPTADGGSGAYVLEDPLCTGTMPVIRLDTKDPYVVSAGESDIFIFYYSSPNSQFAYRIQGERYGTEHLIPTATCDPANKTLKFMEYSKDNRLAVVYIEELFDDYGPCYEFGAILSARYPFPFDLSWAGVEVPELSDGSREVVIFPKNVEPDYAGVNVPTFSDGLRQSMIIKRHLIPRYADVKVPNFSSGVRRQAITVKNSLHDYSDMKVPEFSDGSVRQAIIVRNSVPDYSDVKVPNFSGGSRNVI